MYNNNTLLSNWKKEQKELAEQLAILRQKTSTDALHDLRVAIKKLRAYLDLYILLKAGTDPVVTILKTNFSNTEEFFSIIGRRRDVEICLSLTDVLQKENGCSIPYFRSYLRTMLKITGAWSNTAVHQYQHKELSRFGRLLKEEPIPGYPEKIKYCIDQQTADLPVHFKKPHQLRKILKSVYYWLSLLPGTQAYQPDLLHSILDDLGNWQDLEVLSARLRHYRKDYLPTPFEEYAALKRSGDIIIDKKKVLMKAALVKTTQWLKEINEHK